MAVYGAGRSRFLADYQQEKVAEQQRLEAEYAAAIRARQVEATRKSWWSGGLGLLGSLALGPLGLVGGYALGKLIGGKGREWESGGWKPWQKEGQRTEDVGMTTGKGEFGKWHKQSGRSRALAEQRGLETMDREDYQKDFADIGKVGLQAYVGGGGKFTKGWGGVEEFDPWNWDPGLFASAESEKTLGELVFENQPTTSNTAKESIDPDFLEGILK